MTDSQQQALDFDQRRFLTTLGINAEAALPDTLHIVTEGARAKVQITMEFIATPMGLANAFAAASTQVAPPVEQEQPGQIEFSPLAPDGDAESPES